MSVLLLQCTGKGRKIKRKWASDTTIENTSTELGPSHPLVDAARKQIGVVIEYDGKNYSGGYPPNDRGVCTDVIERAMRSNGLSIKDLIDADFKNHPNR